MRRVLFVVGAAALLVGSLTVPSAGRDRPFNTSDLIAMKLLPGPEQFDLLPGLAGGQFSKKQIEQFTCESGDRVVGSAVDISCKHGGVRAGLRPGQ